jgi:hypothetical protein
MVSAIPKSTGSFPSRISKSQAANRLLPIAPLRSTLYLTARAQFKPSINFFTDVEPEDVPTGIEVSNAGPGPAVVKAITFYVDKKSFGADVDKALEYLNLDSADNVETMTLDKGDTIGVGEHQWLIVDKTMPDGKAQEADYKRFTEAVDKRIAVKVEYCSTNGNQCSVKCSQDDSWCDK